MTMPRLLGRIVFGFMLLGILGQQVVTGIQTQPPPIFGAARTDTEPQARAAARAQNDPFSNGDVGDRNGLIDSAARDIAKVLRKHVGKKALEQIVAESLELRADKDS